jgi:uncharacterized membrane protein
VKCRATLRSIDLLRGVIMVLMAIDHVRVYSGIPAGGKTYAIFFTRWVTHFSAPGFVFFAGCSVFLYSIKLGDKNKLSKYLLFRGLLLVLLELTIVRFFWTFNLNFSDFILAGVFWMLGWCMIIMAAFVHLKPITVGVIGLFIIFFQQLFSFFPGIFPASWQTGIGYFWECIYPADLKSIPGISILYVLVPWIGVMAAGYGFGTILLLQSKKRDKICLWLGIAATTAFIIGAIIVTARQHSSAEKVPFVLRVLNQKKYPASQLFLLMTLGPLIVFIPLAEKAKGWLARVLTIFGKVPLFFYLAHILLIHCGALIINYIREKTITMTRYANAPYVEVEPDQRWALSLLYGEFIIAIFILYFLCRWYAKYKAGNPGLKWLRYF